MKIKDKILEVQNYFKNRLLGRNFEVVKRDKYSIHVTVDGHPFIFWISNGYEYLTEYRFSAPEESNDIYPFIHLDFTEKEKERLYRLLTK
jgi:hypothetical protein